MARLKAEQCIGRDPWWRFEPVMDFLSFPRPITCKSQRVKVERERWARSTQGKSQMVPRVLFALLLLGEAAATPDFAARYRSIQKEYAAQAPAPPLPGAVPDGVFNKSIAARRTWKLALMAMIKDAKTHDIRKLTLADHRALAAAYKELGRDREALPHWRALAAKEAHDENTLLQETLALLANHRVQEAETAFAALRGRFPPSSAQANVARDLYRANLQTGNLPRAAVHLETFVDFQRTLALRTPEAARSWFVQVESVLTTYSRCGRPDRALGCLEKQLSVLEVNARAGGAPHLESLLTDLRAPKIGVLFAVGRRDEAKILWNDELTSTSKVLEKNPRDASAVLRKARLLSLGQYYFPTASSDEKTVVKDIGADYLLATLRDQPNNGMLLLGYASTRERAALQLLEVRQWDAANRHLQEGWSLLAELSVTEPAAKQARGQARQQFLRLARVIGEDRREALVGTKPMLQPPQDTRWLAQPFTDANAKGKVVVLCFWGAFSESSVILMKQLQMLQEKHAGELLVVAYTRPHGLAWDERNRVIRKNPRPSVDNELQAVRAFAQHQLWTFPNGLLAPDTDWPNQWGVSQLPQLVLLDHEGRVRWQRAGWDESDTEPFADAVQQLIATARTPPSPPGKVPSAPSK